MTIRAWAYRVGDRDVTHPAGSELTDLIGDPDVMLWVDLDAESAREERLLVDGFGLHPLVVEDIFSESLPKLEIHDDFTYLIIHGLDRERTAPGELETSEIDIVVGPSFLLTHHDRPSRSIEGVMKALDESPELLAKGPAFLGHAIIDQLVDRYLPLMETFDDVIDELELEVLRGAQPNVLERIFGLKRSLTIVRRIAPHQIDLLKRISEEEIPFIPEDARPFYSDVYDHFLSAAGLADGHRELLSAALDAYVSVQSHRLNEVMKVLTLISTVMLPLTFITGLYGMNFQTMPELSWKYGYAFAWGAMILIASTFLFFFKRRKWL